MIIPTYKLGYDSEKNLFLVISETTGNIQSSWKFKRNAEHCIRGLLRMKKETEKRNSIYGVNRLPVKIGKGVVVK